MTTFDEPALVQQNRERRAAADREQQARREQSAELRRLRGTSTPPVPDPSRTAAALRHAATVAAQRGEISDSTCENEAAPTAAPTANRGLTRPLATDETGGLLG